MTSPTSRRLEIEFTGDTSDAQAAVRRVQATVRRAVARMNNLQATIRVNANTTPATRQVAAWRQLQERNAVKIRIETDLKSIKAISTAVLQMTRGFNLVGLVAGGLSTVTFLVGAATAAAAMATSLGFALTSLTAMIPAAIGLGGAVATVALVIDRIKDSDGWKRVQDDVEKLRDIAADQLVPAFDQFYRAAQRNFPLVQTHIENLAKILSRGLVDIGDFIGGDLAGEQLANIFGFNESAIAALTRALRPLTGVILTLAEASAPLFERFARAVERALNQFDAFLLRTRASGDLAEFFRETGDEMAKWGRIFRNIFAGMGQLIGAAVGPSREWASAFERITEQFRAWASQEKTHESVIRFFRFMKDLPYGDLLQIIAAITAMIVTFKGVQGIVTIVQGFSAAITAIVAAGPVLGTILAVISAIVVALGLLAGAFVFAYTESENFRRIANQSISGFLDKLGEIKDDAKDVFDILKGHWESWMRSDEGRNALRDLRASFVEVKGAALDLWNTITDKINDFKQQLAGARAAFGTVFSGFTEVLAGINDGFAAITDAISLVITAISPAESKFNIAAIAATGFGIALKVIAVVVEVVLKAIAHFIAALALLILGIQEAGEWLVYLGQIMANPKKAWTLEPPWRNGWLTGIDDLQGKIDELSNFNLPDLNDQLANTKSAGDLGANGLTNFANSGTAVKDKVQELRDAYQQAFGEDIPQVVNDSLTEIEARASQHEQFLNEVFKYEQIKKSVADLRAAIEAAGIEIAPEWEQAFKQIEGAADAAKTNATNSFNQLQTNAATSLAGITNASGQTKQEVERHFNEMAASSTNSAQNAQKPWGGVGGGGTFGGIAGGAEGASKSVGNSFGAMQNSITNSANIAANNVIAALGNIRINAPSMNFSNVISAAQSAANAVRSILGGLGGLFGGRALGGPVEPPRWAQRAALGAGRAGAYWVGEHGPELFIPNQSGKVVNTSASQKMASEGSGPIELNVVLTGLPDAFAEYVDVHVTQGQRDQRRFDDGGSSIGGW